MATRSSFTASAMPMKTARPTTEWPMFTSSISWIAATGPTFVTVRPWPACTASPICAPIRAADRNASSRAGSRSDAGGVQAPDAIPQRRRVARQVESALGRDLGPLFGDERHLPRLDALGQREHLWDAGHLEVEDAASLLLDALDVEVLDVAPVLPEMRGDAVGAGAFAQLGGGGRVGFLAPPRLPDRGDMIDVDVEPKMSWASRGHRCCHCSKGLRSTRPNSGERQ
jgi:hypothetical protein